jgi:hypothetical protein
MFSKTLTAVAAIVAATSLAYAQSSSNPTMAPNPGGAAKVEAPGPQKKGKSAQKKKAEDPGQSSSNPSMQPTGPGTAGKTETPAKNAKAKGAKKPADPPSASSSTPSMAPTKN